MTGAPVIRCRGKPHARLVAPGIWEVKCDSRVCGAGNGVIVLHRFATADGSLLETLRFKDPMWREKVNNNGAKHDPAAVRSP